MAKLKSTSKSYAEAAEVLQEKNSVKLGNNTYLEHRSGEFIAVRLHQTDIVKFWPDGRITLHTGGYYSRTTRDRINQFIKGFIRQTAYQWFYIHEGKGVMFEEGMNVGSTRADD
jgi:hypothetical protein